jgi:homoserine kinase
LVTARAPASTSNLGPGFDCLGAALKIALRAHLTDGKPDGSLAARAAEAVTGRRLDARIEIDSDIPVARGLGSSGACVAAGLLLGCTIAGVEPDTDELLRIGTPIEGHPDNLAAALCGGLTIAPSGEPVLRVEPARSVRPIFLVPEQRLSTADARAVLPDMVDRADAVANIARAAGLVALLTGAVEATPERLLTCTQDVLHQPQRAALMPETARVVHELRAGGIAAAVSGAGPSVLCLVVAGGEDSVRDAAGTLGKWQLLEVDWDVTGAQIVEE